jgi:hypothetical protein
MEARIFYTRGWKNEGGFKLIATVEINALEHKPLEGQNLRNTVLGRLFERFNIGDHGGLPIRSMSVGDVVEFQGELWECAGCGWVPVLGNFAFES